MTPRELRAFLFELPQDATVEELRQVLFDSLEQDTEMDEEFTRDIAFALVVRREREKALLCVCDPVEIKPGLTEYTYNPKCGIHDGLNY